MHPALGSLPLAERGFVLGVALAGGDPARARARLAGAAGTRCQEALDALDALAAAGDAGRAAALGALAATVSPPVPAGIERVHPGWLRRALEGERGPVIRAVVAGLPAEVGGVAAELLAARGDAPGVPAPRLKPEAVAALRRCLFATLAPMPAADQPAAPVAAALSALSFPALLEALDRRGAALLGVSLQGAPAPVIARAAAGVGEPLARVLVQAAAAPASASARASARVLAAALRPQEAAAGAARALGLRAVAAEVAAEGPDAVAAVAQRLPPALGEMLLDAAARELA